MGIADLAIRQALDEYLHLVEPAGAAAHAEQLDRFRLDPFAHLEAGHVMVPDLLSMEPTPLHPWDVEREIIAAWVDLPHLTATGRLRFRNVHEEKSRQMGATTVLSYVAWWAVTYHEAPGLVLHRRGSEVDDGGPASTTDSFFGKVRFIHENMPAEYRRPLVWRSSPESTIRDPERSLAYIVGETATPDPGRGGRYKWVLLDEAAIIPWGEAVQASLTRACPEGRFYNSTPRGQGNLYARLRRERPAGYLFLRHHWSRHPLYGVGAHVADLDPDPETKLPRERPDQPSEEAQAIADACESCRLTRAGVTWDPEAPAGERSHRFPGRLSSPWYEAAIIDLTDEQVASELDIDYSGSLAHRVYPTFAEDRHVVDAIPYDERLPIELGWDYGIDTTAVVICQDAPTEYRVIGELEVGGLAPEDVAAALVATLRRLGVPEKILTREWTRQILAIGDPAGEARDLGTGRPLVADYRAAGFSIQSRQQSISRTLNAVRRLLLGRPKPIRVSRSTAPRFVDHMRENRWPTDGKGQRIPDRPPLNDEHNHMMRAFAYLATWKFPPPTADDSQRSAAKPKVDRPDRGRIDPGLGYDMKL